MEEDRRGIGFGLISFTPAENDGEFCEEVALNEVKLITFAISGSVEDGVSFCILILD